MDSIALNRKFKLKFEQVPNDYLNPSANTGDLGLKIDTEVSNNNPDSFINTNEPIFSYSEVSAVTPGGFALHQKPVAICVLNTSNNYLDLTSKMEYLRIGMPFPSYVSNIETNNIDPSKDQIFRIKFNYKYNIDSSYNQSRSIHIIYFRSNGFTTTTFSNEAYTLYPNLILLTSFDMFIKDNILYLEFSFIDSSGNGYLSFFNLINNVSSYFPKNTTKKIEIIKESIANGGLFKILIDDNKVLELKNIYSHSLKYNYTPDISFFQRYNIKSDVLISSTSNVSSKNSLISSNMNTGTLVKTANSSSRVLQTLPPFNRSYTFSGTVSSPTIKSTLNGSTTTHCTNLSGYKTFIDSITKQITADQYIDDLEIEDEIYLLKKELNKDFLNPISITTEEADKEFSFDLFPISVPVRGDFEYPILDPITVDVGKDINEDLFPISVPVRGDFEYPLLDPIILEVQWDKSETDLFNITLDVDAPVYQLELGPEFVSGWDDRKYLVFRNGHLLPKQTYNIIIPSHHNNYLKKILYSTVGFNKGDRIEVFYIENQENFANVPFNRETRVASYIYYAKSNNQKLIKIPYPNSSYRRSKDSFMLFNDKGEHLDCRYDYTVSVDGRYVTLSEKAKLELMMINYVVFTFCYVENRSIDGQEDETDMFDNNNVSEIKYEYSYSIQNLTDTTGLVTFTPAFTGWPNMRQDNFMLFGNSVFIEPERYELVSNNQIQFLDPTEQQIANKRRYTMCIPIKETKPQNLTTNQIRYEVKLLENTGTTDKSTFILQPPTIGTEWYPFLIFRGTRLMDVEDEYVYDDVNNILQITDSSCYLKPGRHLVVVYLDKTYTNLKKDIRYIKMQIEVDPSGATTIPDYLYKNPNIQFDSSNLLVFINGVFLEPERYTIEPGNIIKLDPDPSISGYIPPYDDLLITAIYLLEFPDTDTNMEEFNDEYGQKEVDPSEDNDETRFDEMYSYVKKKE